MYWWDIHSQRIYLVSRHCYVIRGWIECAHSEHSMLNSDSVVVEGVGIQRASLGKSSRRSKIILKEWQLNFSNIFVYISQLLYEGCCCYWRRGVSITSMKHRSLQLFDRHPV